MMTFREGEPQFIAMFKKSLWYFVSKRMVSNLLKKCFPVSSGGLFNHKTNLSSFRLWLRKPSMNCSRSIMSIWICLLPSTRIYREWSIVLVSEGHLEVDVIFEAILEDIMNILAGSSSGISSDLRNKKLIYQRLILYLKNMNLFEQVCTIHMKIGRI